MRTAARLLLACLGALALAAPAQAARADAPTGLHGVPAPRRTRPRTTTFAAHAVVRVEPGRGRAPLRVPALDREPLPRERHPLRGRGADEPGRRRSARTAVDYRQPALALRAGPRRPAEQRHAVERSHSASTCAGGRFRRRSRRYPGLLRWTPVEGATGYAVWYLFPDGTETKVHVLTNVVDQREWYTLHQGSSFSGKVKWRIRAFRRVYGNRANGLPATSYGPWSPIYSTANPAFATGPMKALATASDTVGHAASPDTHRLAPAFLFSGNTSLYNQTAELYRVHVFTDRDCINRVFSSPVIGSPAYAPRPLGPPGGSPSRTAFTPGARVNAVTFDGEAITPNEELPPAAPFTGANAPDPTTGSSTAAATPAPVGPGEVGAPGDLWDIDFDRGARYFWTVIPVGSVTSSGGAALLGAPAASGDKQVTVAGSALRSRRRGHDRRRAEPGQGNRRQRLRRHARPLQRTDVRARPRRGRRTDVVDDRHLP